MSGTNVKGFEVPTVECRHCHSQVATNSLKRHEAKCEDSSPEERAERAHAREAAIRNYRARRDEGMKPLPKTANGVQWKEKPSRAVAPAARPGACRYCHATIIPRMLGMHEAKCATQSPEQREITARYRENSRVSKARIAQGAVVKRHAAVHVNGHGGRRFIATISVDFNTLRTVLLELAPSLAIDKIEVA